MPGSESTGARERSPLPSTGSGLFSPVGVGGLSKVIVEQIRLLIRQGHLRPGDRLPPERLLCQRFGVSRNTVHEALHALETSGLVKIHTGARGGAVITSPSGNRVSEMITHLLIMSDIRAAHVAEVRLVLETGIAPITCQRATQDDITDLETICERSRTALRNGTYTMPMSLEFHVRAARAAHNLAIEMLVDSLHGPILRSLQRAKENAPEMGVLSTDEHELYIGAIRRRDPAEATHIMHEHLTRSANRLMR